jgi:hypothetical protein
MTARTGFSCDCFQTIEFLKRLMKGEKQHSFIVTTDNWRKLLFQKLTHLGTYLS